jgi:hypothetical protein
LESWEPSQHSLIDTAQHPRRPESSTSTLRELQTSRRSNLHGRISRFLTATPSCFNEHFICGTTILIRFKLRTVRYIPIITRVDIPTCLLVTLRLGLAVTHYPRNPVRTMQLPTPKGGISKLLCEFRDGASKWTMYCKISIGSPFSKAYIWAG